MTEIFELLGYGVLVDLTGAHQHFGYLDEYLLSLLFAAEDGDQACAYMLKAHGIDFPASLIVDHIYVPQQIEVGGLNCHLLVDSDARVGHFDEFWLLLIYGLLDFGLLRVCRGGNLFDDWRDDLFGRRQFGLHDGYMRQLFTKWINE